LGSLYLVNERFDDWPTFFDKLKSLPIDFGPFFWRPVFVVGWRVFAHW
jgi:hypothetical protein